MDSKLENNENMDKMADEYSKIKMLPNYKRRTRNPWRQPETAALPVCDTYCWPLMVLLLYFAFNLEYNSGYGTQIYDTDGGLGRVQSCEGTFRDINNLF